MYRKRMYRKKKLGRKVRRKIARGKRIYRAKKLHVFSEVFKASPLTIQQDSTTTNLPAQFLTANIGSISQYGQYKALYSKYRILKLEWTFLPLFMGAEVNQAEFNEGTASVVDTNNWMHYRRAWNLVTNTYPASELAMLQENGVRTLMLSGQRKPIRISMKYPSPQLSSVDALGNTTSESKNRWLSFDDSVKPDHGGLFTYVCNRSDGVVQGAGAVVADVYCKITFAVDDPR